MFDAGIVRCVIAALLLALAACGPGNRLRPGGSHDQAQAVAPASSAPDGMAYLKVDGRNLRDAAGKAVLLRGVNLGCWLALESGFMGLDFTDESGLWRDLEARLGRADMARFREAWRATWITAEDFRRIAELGFNHVRLPFYYGLLEDDAAPGQYLEDGWRWLDQALAWAEAAGLYVVLDLHGAPGGQSRADHTGQKDRNALWGDVTLRRRAAELWAAVARRYRGRGVVAGLDLLNEPMHPPSGVALVDTLDELYRAVRAVDAERPLIIEEGYKGLHRLPIPPQWGWNGVVYSQHHYPTMGMSNPPALIHTAFIQLGFPLIQKEQDRVDVPLYIGEWSVIHESAGGAGMFKTYVQAMDARGWSWALWLYKQTSRGAVFENWSLYRNRAPLDLPDVRRDDLATLLAKLPAMHTDRLELNAPVARALR